LKISITVFQSDVISAIFLVSGSITMDSGQPPSIIHQAKVPNNKPMQKAPIFYKENMYSIVIIIIIVVIIMVIIIIMIKKYDYFL
jgi:hypothetical protein